MPGDTCLVCGSNCSSDPGASFRRFPSDSERRSTWLSIFQLEESDIKSYSRGFTVPCNQLLLPADRSLDSLQSNHHLNAGIA